MLRSGWFARPLPPPILSSAEQRLAHGISANAKTQIAALLDLLHLHYDGADEATPSVTNRDEVTIILGDHKNEAVDARVSST